MTYLRSASSVLSVLVVTTGALGQVQTAPVKPQAAGTVTLVPTPQVVLNGRKIVSAVAALPKEKQQDATTVVATASAALGAAPDTGSLFLAMLEYQRLVSKDAATDAKFAADAKALAVMAKMAKLNLDNKAIDAGMSEAREKATNLMDAATVSLVMGLIGGVVQVGAASVATAADPWRGSDVALVAVSEQTLTQGLPATARAAVDRQVDAMLAAVTRAWDAKTSVAAAMGSVLSKESALAPVDRDEVMAFALCRVHRRALDELEAAIKAKKAGKTDPAKPSYDVALKRARITFTGVALLVKQLRKKDP